MNKLTQRDLLLNSVRKDIDAADAVSFDVFDTLLLRPYARPSDMFIHLEESAHRPGFARARYDAERRAEAKLAREVTLDDIYSEIEDEYKDIKPGEAEFEKRVLCQNPELKEVYDYAQATGKKIIIASDMYLPSAIIAEALRKNGYDGWDMLLVSGELGMAKHTGEMYRHILRSLDIRKPSRLLHIGDNKRADSKVPRKMGIKAYRYKSVWRRFISSNRRLFDYYCGREWKLGASVLLGMLAIHRQKIRCSGNDNYWHRLGYEYAGPVACAYAEFAARECTRHQLTKLLWVARDGYTLRKVCDVLHPEIASAYIYAPRFLSTACRLDTAAKTPHQCERLALHYAEACPELQQALAAERPASEEEYKDFIGRHRALAESTARREMDTYRAYLATMVHEEDRVGMVDTITINFSAQKLVQEALERPAQGIYWVYSYGNINKSLPKFPYSEFVADMRNTSDEGGIFTGCWDFMEFLLTAPEAPVHSISANLEPVHCPTPQPEEQLRIRIYTQVAQGAYDFACEFVRLFGSDCSLWGSKLIIDWVDSLLQKPSREDITQFAPVCKAMDSAHTIYEPLLVEPCSLLRVLAHPRRMRKRIKRSFWHTPGHIFLLCILKPFKLQRKGLRHWSLAFLPHLSREHFVAALRFGRAGSLHFIVGKPTSVIFE